MDPVEIKRRGYQKQRRAFLQKGRKSGCDDCNCHNLFIPPTKPRGFVVSINEPHCHEGQLTSLGGSNTLIYDQNEKWPRAALWVSKELAAWPIRPMTSRDFAACRNDCEDIQGNKIITYFVSYYGDIKLPALSNKVRQITQMANDKGAGLCILSDSNSHSILWGEAETNSRGSKWETFIAQQSLTVCNTGDQNTYHRKGVATAIDIMVANNVIANQIEHFQVVNFAPNSDHIGIQAALPQALSLRNALSGKLTGQEY